MVTLSTTQARHLRATFLAAAELLKEEPVVKKKRRARDEKFNEQYSTGKWKKPAHLKKKKA
jgi:hypothetical protein